MSAEVAPGALDHSRSLVQISYLPLSGPAEQYSSPRRKGQDKKTEGCVAVTFGDKGEGALEGLGHLWKMGCMTPHQPLPFHCAMPTHPGLVSLSEIWNRLISMTNSRTQAWRIYLIKLMLFAKKVKRDWGVGGCGDSLVVEGLPSMCKALGSISSTGEVWKC